MQNPKTSLAIANKPQIFGNFSTGVTAHALPSDTSGTNAVMYSGTYQDILRLTRYTKTELEKLASDFCNTVNVPRQNARKIQAIASEILARGHVRDTFRFCGGHAHDLFTAPNKTRLANARAVSVNNLEKYTKLTAMPTRSRRKSEHEGEWDYSRQWDTHPFMRRVSASQPRKMVTLNIHMGFNAFQDASDADKYGEFVCGLVNILGTRGIAIEINMLNHGQGINEKRDLNIFASIKVKKAETFMPLPDLLNAFSSNFYRRSIFTLIILSAFAYGSSPSIGLGSPWPHDTNFKIDKQNGKIDIYSYVKGGMSDDILREALAAFA